MRDYFTTQAEKDLAEEVLEMLESKSISALVQLWANLVLPVLLAMGSQEGVEWRNRHPLNVLLVEKACQLSGLDDTDVHLDTVRTIRAACAYNLINVARQERQA